MTYAFRAILWRWDSESAAWFFVTLPTEIADQIAEISSNQAKPGFGSVPVQVSLGNSKWQTSLFPSRSEASYLLPIKRQVRVAEKISEDSAVEIKLTLIN